MPSDSSEPVGYLQETPIDDFGPDYSGSVPSFLKLNPENVAPISDRAP